MLQSAVTMKDRVILHCDMNGFFASIELLDYPELRDKPMAVCGNPRSRHGIILAKNEIAKAHGIVTAETLWQARKKCPDLVTVPPHHEKYRHYSGLINGLYQEFTDQVEPFSIDESWLDVTGSGRLFGTGVEIADAIRTKVRETYNLTLSVGVSFNKIFAKMGSEYKKSRRHNGDNERQFQRYAVADGHRRTLFCGRCHCTEASHLRNKNDRRIGGIRPIHGHGASGEARRRNS